ncbi:FKBP-type peptidyl-prolyl cis-trans isomerase SlyD [Natronospira proteinivora]|uniref:Peptidyl-prolyl cis-trans isomerase n=1 Tax=Natronospira proteinivora TaxID=1807133 RepID=A0ABT1G7W9_9GAMM|nr:peptidylprolyl isomerase [Natronospira proteinivora]MCP1727321.1 FKBP-type peptidyl-prolyl cis-trans isomerase SlyD [Natronospira proteinivora]
MEVANKRVVEIDYTLKDNEGNVLDSSEGREPLAFIQGTQSIIPGLEQGIEGWEEGQSGAVEVAPEDGYGEHNDELKQEVPKDVFQADSEIEPGMRFQAVGEGGQTQIITVVKVEDDKVLIDANHPLAGQTLHFDVKIAGVRDATDDELEAGQPAGADEEQ